jgi:transcriptional regulator with XRE-family HTH domain
VLSTLFFENVFACCVDSTFLICYIIFADVFNANERSGVINVNDRIKEIRKSLNLSQEEFGKRLGVSRGVVVNMELNRAEIKPLFIEHLCSVFSVNKEWLFSGRGEMFVETDKSVISTLAAEYDLDALDQKIVECYLNLGTLQRKVIKDYLRSLVDAVLSDENYDDYREEYVKENAGAVAARGGHSEQIGELKDLYDSGDSEKK